MGEIKMLVAKEKGFEFLGQQAVERQICGETDGIIV